MSRSSEYVVQRALPGVAEALRAVSGLASIVVLACLLTWLTLRGESYAEERGGESTRPVPTIPSRHVMHEPARVVFYVVESAEQARWVAWAEAMGNDSRMQPGPPYEVLVLQAGEHGDLYEAGQLILRHLLSVQDELLVEAIDFRSPASLE